MVIEDREDCREAVLLPTRRRPYRSWSFTFSAVLGLLPASQKELAFLKDEFIHELQDGFR